MEYFRNKDGAVIVSDLIETIQKNKEYLSEIDGAIGDGDHGINMNKGFTLCSERLNKDMDLKDSLNLLGDILLCEIGGSMGPIYGSFFNRMSEIVKNTEDIDETIFGEMLEAGLNGIRELVPTDIGDKTLLDALIPAVNAYCGAEKAGKDFSEALDAAALAAEKGKEATRDMVAKVGRASRLGERSRGVLDAGAVSCALIVRSLCATTQKLIAERNRDYGKKTIVIGCDNAAVELKDMLKEYIQNLGYLVEDIGCYSKEDETYYPHVAQKLCQEIEKSGFEKEGILLCGTGIGMAMTANKCPGIRAAVCHDNFSAERAKLSNDGNVLCMGARVIGAELAKKIVKEWLAIEFQGGASGPKVNSMIEIEHKNFKREL